jgi:3-methyl-2-oxobutanoate hydroxymethyltransferase
VLVYHDVLGIEDRVTPKFVRRYAELGTGATEALGRFVRDVRTGMFPAEAETYHLSGAQAEALGLYGRA